ncbi:MAG: adenylate cyclase [Cytophagales bacterium]|nr:adenylate cyclase [Armatimonadota bacterium]
MSGTVKTSRGVLLQHYLGARWRLARLQGEALAHYQDRLARQVVVHAAARSPYYAAHFAGYDLADWRSLPITDKRGMMADFTAFNTQGVPGDLAMRTALHAEQNRDFRPQVPGTDLTVGLSSGTSGHRGLFLVGPRERAAWAGALLARVLPGPLLRKGGWRVALFHRSGSNLYQSLASRVLSFCFFDLMTPLAEAVAALNESSPHLLVGPPTLLSLLAEERRAGRLRICPEKIISVAEVLEPQDAERIAAAFDVPIVHQIYQCTEGLIGVTCESGALHLQEDIVAIQAEPLEPGAAEGGGMRATPVVTDLWRRVQPILRYRLNDVLTLAAETALPCVCGSRFRRILQIEGRCDDVLQFPCSGGRELRSFFPDTLRRAVLLADACITDYRVLQDTPGRVRVYLSCLPESGFGTAAAAVRAGIARTVAFHGCRAEQIVVEQGLPPEPAAGKRRRVRRI